MLKLFNKKLLLFIILSLITAFISWHYGKHVKLSSQLEIYKILLTVASIIFAIMGAWLSLLKVEITQGIQNAKSNEDGNYYVSKARKIINPMSSSALVIIFSLIYVFIYYSITDIPTIHCYAENLRIGSFFCLTLLTLWQLLSLITVMFSGVEFLLNISSDNMDRKADRNR